MACTPRRLRPSRLRWSLRLLACGPWGRWCRWV